MSRVKWVNHARWGWLPDDAPMFEAGFANDTRLRLGLGPCRTDDGRLGLYTQHYDGWFTNHEQGVDGSSISMYAPLTTAARDLLAALRAEVTP